MPRILPILAVILGIVWVVPMLEDAFTPAPPPPPPAPTVVVVESGDGGMIALLTGVLFVVVIVGTAALTVWATRRQLRRQRAELAALRAHRNTLGRIILDEVDPDVLADPPGTVRGRQVYPRE
jgi:hypothetical protein